MKDYKNKKTCRLCKSKVIKILKLNPTPLANNLEKNLKKSINSKIYDLDLYRCSKCFHVQLGIVINANVLFKDYLYRTGISKEFHKHFDKYAADLSKNKKTKNTIVDIGSNDGTLLDYFLKRGYDTIGVDPARNLKKYNNKNHKIFLEFFTYKTVKKIKAVSKNIDFIVANNVFAHIDDLEKVILNCKKLMTEKTVLSFEVSYLREVLNKNLFDTIYHEHLDYHHLKPLIKFFKRLNLFLFDAKIVKTHGGSIRIYVKRNNKKLKISSRLKKLIKFENDLGLNSKKTNVFKIFENKIHYLRKNLLKEIKKFKNKKIIGFGVPAKLVTLFFQLGLNKINIINLIDDNQLKQKKFLPGTNIKVVSKKTTKEKRKCDDNNFCLECCCKYFKKNK
jgi:2-polyprenyl-3-methyl-5-hydroxy-6-metoxy-1,4-benzoquinol methylase